MEDGRRNRRSRSIGSRGSERARIPRREQGQEERGENPCEHPGEALLLPRCPSRNRHGESGDEFAPDPRDDADDVEVQHGTAEADDPKPPRTPSGDEEEEKPEFQKEPELKSVRDNRPVLLLLARRLRRWRSLGSLGSGGSSGRSGRNGEDEMKSVWNREVATGEDFRDAGRVRCEDLAAKDQPDGRQRRPAFLGDDGANVTNRRCSRVHAVPAFRNLRIWALQHDGDLVHLEGFWFFERGRFV